MTPTAPYKGSAEVKEDEEADERLKKKIELHMKFAVWGSEALSTGRPAQPEWPRGGHTDVSHGVVRLFYPSNLSNQKQRKQIPLATVVCDKENHTQFLHTEDRGSSVGSVRGSQGYFLGGLLYLVKFYF